MKLLLWTSAGMVLYGYVGYPLLLLVFANIWRLGSTLRHALRKKDSSDLSPSEFMPSVSLVISAYNEEAVIARKMRNCEQLNYPQDRLEILLGCDGCTDKTSEIARSAQLPNARVFEFSKRSGKLTVLNALLQECRGEIVVFSDASTILNEHAIRNLVRHFSDPVIGCVSGEMRLVSSEGKSSTESIYWRYEVFVKRLESRLNLLLGASGCLYAIRRNLFTPLSRWAINEDFLIPLRIRAKGHRQVYDSEAVSYEDAASVWHDFHRHIRIGAGNFHALRYTLGLLSPLAGPIAFSFWSHKIIRWLVPFALPCAFISALILAADPFYAALALAGGLFVLLAVVGHHLELRNVHWRLFSIPYYFLSLNLALALGFVRFLTSTQGATWERTVENQTVS